MKGFLRFVFSLAVLAILAGGGGLFLINERYDHQGPLAEDARVIIRPGDGLAVISSKLDQIGAIEHPLLFQVSVKVKGKDRRLRAGEYALPPGVSMAGIVEVLESGQSIQRRLTIPEGLTSREVVALIAKAEGLVGEIDHLPREGSLLPETYYYTWGDDRGELLGRLQTAMQDTLSELWQKRDKSLPLSSKEDVVILASIVEKETGVAEERPLVASVFVNRLNKGMRLQSDPTVVYALTDGKRDLGRALTRKDWEVDSPYNTYQIPALPVGAIANPGRASLEAVLNPAESEFIYFVADGTGGHAFAKTLQEHNRNVAKWRQIRRQDTQ